MLKAKEDPDDLVIINVEGTDFQCNRKKLSKFSPYFDVMFNGNFAEKNEKRIYIQVVKVTAVKNILNLLDNSSYYIDNEDLFDTLQGASMLQFDTIEQHCIKRLTDNINTNYCLRIWTIADQLDMHPLAEKAKCKALMEFNTIKESDNILPLNIKELHSYLANTLLHCDNELDVFEAGMKWWYDHSKKLENSEENYDNEEELSYETKCLLVVLRCLDLKNMTKIDIENMLLISPDVMSNVTINRILKTIISLMGNVDIDEQEYIKKLAKELYFDCNRRGKIFLPCVVSSEINIEPEKPKRVKYTCNCTKSVHLYYFDEKNQTMKKLFDLRCQNDLRCNALLEGFQMLPYKENLLFFGGEYQFGTSDWNKSLWIYNTFKEEWQLLTRLPTERRHFKAIIIQEKLYIIGGTGKYRILQDNMLCYDLKSDEWIENIKLPEALFSIKCCEYKKSLFVISGKFSNKFGFLYNNQSQDWQRLNITDPSALLIKDIEDFIVFSKQDKLYIKSTYLIEMELIGAELVIKSCVSSYPLTGDELGFCQNENELLMFSTHLSERDFSNIYLLESWNLIKNKTRLLIQINDNLDVTWNISSGCFAFFHYSIARENNFTSTFVF